MIEIKIKYRNYKLQLQLEHKVTVILGNSATGKSTIHKILTDGDVTFTKKISDSRYNLAYLSISGALENAIDNHGKFKEYKIYLIDEGRLEIDDKIAKAIQNSVNCYFVITSRNLFGKLNYDLQDVKEIETQTNGVSVLKDYIHTQKRHTEELRNIQDIQEIVIEDSGRAKIWFSELLVKLNISIESPDKNGKEQVLNKVEDKLLNTNGKILIIFDRCSFGICSKKFKGIIEKYGNQILILNNYKSWEYLILQSNMFKNMFISYDINIPKFEEAYYEELLHTLSKSCKHTTINYDKGSKLPKCYTDPCCPYKQSINYCTAGLSGEDKFIALLKDTIFKDLLIIARRI